MSMGVSKYLLGLAVGACPLWNANALYAVNDPSIRHRYMPAASPHLVYMRFCVQFSLQLNADITRAKVQILNSLSGAVRRH